MHAAQAGIAEARLELKQRAARGGRKAGAKHQVPRLGVVELDSARKILACLERAMKLADEATLSPLERISAVCRIASVATNLLRVELEAGAQDTKRVASPVRIEWERMGPAELDAIATLQAFERRQREPEVTNAA